MKQKTACAPHPGRPREFDRDEALQIAMKLFCRHGYEGVSIAELTQAMNISPPSLYAAFGGKESLYREALLCYQQRGGLPHPQWSGSIRDQVERMLRDAVHSVTDPSYPPGCMVVAGMLNCSAELEGLAGTLTEMRNARCREFSEILRAAIARGELAPKTNAEALSRYVGALIQGIAIQAKDGASTAELMSMVDVALTCWPP